MEHELIDCIFLMACLAEVAKIAKATGRKNTLRMISHYYGLAQKRHEDENPPWLED